MSNSSSVVASTRRAPGEVRDALISFLTDRPRGAKLKEIYEAANRKLGVFVNPSTIRTYLLNNSGSKFEKLERGRYRLRGVVQHTIRKGAGKGYTFGTVKLYSGDCVDWLVEQPENSIHGVVTDPPYGIEYSKTEQRKLRQGTGGIWRLPPVFDGNARSPLPRFTVLTENELRQLDDFFVRWANALLPVLVPGAHVMLASNALLSGRISVAIASTGLERRGGIIRLVQTMRGGDKPKNAHDEFPEVVGLPRSMWEPWILFRKPLEGRMQDNLRKWGTGGLRSIAPGKPFGDVILSGRTDRLERSIAPHPSLKPQAFLRQVVRAILPLGEGVVLDPFAGSGSTLAAAQHLGYQSIGIEWDSKYVAVARKAIPKLSRLDVF